VTTEACRDWRGPLGAAALGRADPAEEIGLRAHLDGCAACRAELRDLTAVARALDSVSATDIISPPSEPSGALAGRVLERVARERGAQSARRNRRVMAGVSAFVAAAAVVIAVVLVVGGGAGPAPGTRVVLEGVGGARASTVLRAGPVGTHVDMKVAGLEPGQYYWLWLTGASGHRIPAGTFGGRRQSTDLQLTAALPLAKARRIWVTDDKDRVVLDARIPSTE
jgi:hypothetical protein